MSDGELIYRCSRILGASDTIKNMFHKSQGDKD